MKNTALFAFDSLHELMPDGETIRVTNIDGGFYTFKINPNLGKVIALRMHGRRLLIVHEYGFETFQPALDPLRFRMESFPSMRIS